MWHHQRGPFGRHHHAHQPLSRRALTQLYNDAKVSLENTQRSNAQATPFDDDPEVVALRRGFQVQQDRLLAWGMHWADRRASTSAGKGKAQEAGYDVDIDDKVNQANLGEVVADIMENIRSTLAQSGHLQHPGRFADPGAGGGPPMQIASSGGGIWGGLLKGRLGNVVGDGNTEKGSAKAANVDRKDWKEYELTTGRELLGKLRESIDLLYQLDSSQEDEVSKQKQKEKELERERERTTSSDVLRSAVTTPGQPVSIPDRMRTISIDDAFNTEKPDPIVHWLLSHPLYIDFSTLQPMHDSNAPAKPPTYKEARENTTPIQTRSIYFFPTQQIHVLVDLARAKSLPLFSENMCNDDLFKQAHELSGIVSGKGLLTWDGHLKLLGFTLAAANSRFGLVYALPAPEDPTALQAYQTLTTSIQATLEHESSFPTLENKFRLAYNIALNATGYLAHNECHGHIKSSSIIFLRENDNPRLGKTLRCPYLLQPVQKLAGETSVIQSLSATIYHHSDADEAGYGVVPAFDIFSVGLVLLEIGLWRPLRTFYKERYADRAEFHDKLRKYYIPKLTSKCGTRYMKLVQACFDAPEELQDKPATVDAAEYLLEIVEGLGKCCALDEQGQPSELDIEVFESMIEAQRLDEAPQPKPIATRSPAVTSSPAPQARTTQLMKASTSSKPKQKSADGLRKWPELDIPQDHLETWNNMLMPRLSRMLKNALKDSVDSCSVSLMMIGSTPEKAKTTICVQCRDTARVRETLCNRFKPKSGWGLVVCAGDVRRSGQISRKPKRRSSGPNARRSGADTESISRTTDDRPREQLYQHYPGSGASIGAWTNDMHLPPVSFGGTIIVDGQPYGMTVHHMLDDPDSIGEMLDQASPEAPKRSTAPRTAMRTVDIETGNRFSRGLAPGESLPEALDELELYDNDELVDTTDEDDDVLSDAGSDASTIKPDYMVMDEEGDDFFFADDGNDEPPDLDDDEYGSSDESDGEDDIETGSIGDTPSIHDDRYDDEDYCVTQPAFDDVPDNFWSDDLEERDIEHLCSHSFGLVHASSGLKRMKKGNIKHEIDWALIRIKETRLTAAVNPEAVPGNSKTKKKPWQRVSPSSSEPPLTAVTPLTALPRLRVTSRARTSGRQTGVISPAMSLLKLPGRTSFSMSYTIEGTPSRNGMAMGMAGDSGAWVYSEEKKELAGHILAWSDALKVAFIAPMELLLEDLRERLGAQEIRLPAQRSQPAMNVAVLPSLKEQATQSATSTVDENAEGKDTSMLNDSKKNRPTPPPAHVISHTAANIAPAFYDATLEAKLRSLQLNTNTATLERAARLISRPSSKQSFRADDTSPVSASGARRSSAVPRTNSPKTQASRTNSPTELAKAQTDLKLVMSDAKSRDVYEYKCDARKGLVVTRVIPN